MLTSNARIICASNCSLRERVRQGKCREDLYQRLKGGKLVSSLASNNNERAPSIDLSLASAVKRRVRVVYEQANQTQRRAAKLLAISRSTLARHLRGVAQE